MVTTVLAQLAKKEIDFKGVLAFIDQHYTHEAIPFTNGSLRNAATENQGSATVFSFARQQGLGKEETLQLFAEHYQAVLDEPEGNNHQNIRQFMIHGWEGVVLGA